MTFLSLFHDIILPFQRKRRGKHNNLSLSLSISKLVPATCSLVGYIDIHYFALSNPITKSNPIPSVIYLYGSWPSRCRMKTQPKPFPGCDFAGRPLPRNHVMNFARYKRLGADARGSRCNVNPLTVRERVFAELMSHEREQDRARRTLEWEGTDREERRTARRPMRREATRKGRKRDGDNPRASVRPFV